MLCIAGISVFHEGLEHQIHNIESILSPIKWPRGINGLNFEEPDREESTTQQTMVLSSTRTSHHSNLREHTCTCRNALRMKNEIQPVHHIFSANEPVDIKTMGGNCKEGEQTLHYRPHRHRNGSRSWSAHMAPGPSHKEVEHWDHL